MFCVAHAHISDGSLSGVDKGLRQVCAGRHGSDRDGENEKIQRETCCSGLFRKYSEWGGATYRRNSLTRYGDTHCGCLYGNWEVQIYCSKGWT